MPPAAERLAFVCPRFADGATVLGGAETLLRNQAECAAGAGRQVTFLTTCATNHFTWQNELVPGRQRRGKLDVHFFPVDQDRNVETFLRIQNIISRRGHYNAADETTWLRNSVNSQALYQHLTEYGAAYDRIIVGPYLFGLSVFAARIHPAKTILVPCLHDEGFAYARVFRELFHSVTGIMFNSQPESELAQRLYDLPVSRGAVVGMGLNDFPIRPNAFASKHGLTQPYLIYAGRREAGACRKPCLLRAGVSRRARLR